MASMFSTPTPQAPPPPPPDNSYQRQMERENARAGELAESKARSSKTRSAGTRIALKKNEDEAAGLSGASNALGL